MTKGQIMNGPKVGHLFNWYKYQFVYQVLEGKYLKTILSRAIYVKYEETEI